MIFPPPTLTTPRLRLRPPTLEDAPAVFEAYARDPEVTRFLSWPPHTSLDDTRAFLEIAIRTWRSGRGHRAWMITLREDDRLVGTIGATLDHHGVALGYALGKSWWGRGYMPEAAIAVCDAAFVEPSIHRVWAYCDVDNLASARVMEKAGMVFEGTLRRFVVHQNVSGTPRDCRVYARVRS